jgi:hypothetical protein
MTTQVQKALAGRLELEIPLGAAMLTTFEVGRILRLSRWTLGAWRAVGQGPPFVKLARNTVRYPRRVFERWLRQRLRGAALASGKER